MKTVSKDSDGGKTAGQATLPPPKETAYEEQLYCIAMANIHFTDEEKADPYFRDQSNMRVKLAATMAKYDAILQGMSTVEREAYITSNMPAAGTEEHLVFSAKKGGYKKEEESD